MNIHWIFSKSKLSVITECILNFSKPLNLLNIQKLSLNIYIYLARKPVFRYPNPNVFNHLMELTRDKVFWSKHIRYTLWDSNRHTYEYQNCLINLEVPIPKHDQLLSYPSRRHSRHTHLPGSVRLLVTRLSSTPTHQSGCEQSLADNGRSNSDVAELADADVKFTQIVSMSLSLT